jgi:hypothetical protein
VLLRSNIVTNKSETAINVEKLKEINPIININLDLLSVDKQDLYIQSFKY